MNDNLDYTEYNDEKNRIPWKRIFLTLLIFVLAFVIVILILKACTKPSLREDLIEAGKDYYEKYPASLPTEVGECYTVSLKDLEQEGLVKVNNYSTCDQTSTYVNVCYLESKTYHYSAILSCDVESTNYGMWQNGTEANLTDSSDVRFKYLGEEKNSGTKYYYPNNLTDVSKVNEYYATLPNANYGGKEDEQTGYKWYTEKTIKSYWNNGQYSSTQPSGYTNKGESTTTSTFSEARPASASYRTIQNENALTYYRSQTEARPIRLLCSASDNDRDIIYTSELTCPDDHPVMEKIYYSCDGTTEAAKDTICSDWTDWSTNVCTASVINGINCESKIGYYYTDTMWKWYNNVTVKNYYPSGSSDAGKESTYYVEQPISGSIKDENTKMSVYKFYKLEKTEDTTTYEEWLQVTDGYVTIGDLLTTFTNLNYNVSNLKDINNIDIIRYQYQLQYRDLEG